MRLDCCTEGAAAEYFDLERSARDQIARLVLEDDRSGKSGKRVGGGGRNREAVHRSSAVPSCFPLRTHLLKENPLFPLRLNHRWGEGVALDSRC